MSIFRRNTLRCIIDDDASFRVVMLYAQSIYHVELSQVPDLKFLGLFFAILPQSTVSLLPQRKCYV